jgi:lipoyl(octanoyl) transferase
MEVRYLGLQDYETTWHAMQQFTQDRTPHTPDELWITEHPSVYTLGLNGKSEHILNAGNIPVIKSDRGGQVTYHGPGQLIVYTLLDIKRLDLNIRELVSALENTMIQVLKSYGHTAIARADAPGVYVDEQKIGSIGLRIKRNCSYHGLSLNNTIDLDPFNNINPCGYAGLKATSLAELGVKLSTTELATSVVNEITQQLTT